MYIQIGYGAGSAVSFSAVAPRQRLRLIELCSSERGCGESNLVDHREKAVDEVSASLRSRCTICHCRHIKSHFFYYLASVNTGISCAFKPARSTEYCSSNLRYFSKSNSLLFIILALPLHIPYLQSLRITLSHQTPTPRATISYLPEGLYEPPMYGEVPRVELWRMWESVEK